MSHGARGSTRVPLFGHGPGAREHAVKTGSAGIISGSLMGHRGALVLIGAGLALFPACSGDNCASAAGMLEPCREELQQMLNTIPLPSASDECSTAESRCWAGCVIMTAMASCKYIVEAERYFLTLGPNSTLSPPAKAFIDCTAECLR